MLFFLLTAFCILPLFFIFIIVIIFVQIFLLWRVAHHYIWHPYKHASFFLLKQIHIKEVNISEYNICEVDYLSIINKEIVLNQEVNNRTRTKWPSAI